MPMAGREALDRARQACGLEVIDLWIGSVALGGNLTFGDVRRYLSDGGWLEPLEYDILAVVVNEALKARHLDPAVPYSSVI